MGITASGKGGGQDFDPIPEGLHHAICYGLYDIGTQHFNIKGKEQAKHQVIIQWELPDIRIDIDKNDTMVNLPRAISKKYNLSLHEKANLRKDLKTWRGKDFTPTELEWFDITKLLGVNCELQIIWDIKGDKKYANVENVLPWREAKTEPENETRFFSFEDSVNLPANTPAWIADLVTSADEWSGGAEPTQEPDMHGPAEEEGPPIPDEGEIPF